MVTSTFHISHLWRYGHYIFLTSDHCVRLTPSAKFSSSKAFGCFNRDSCIRNFEVAAVSYSAYRLAFSVWNIGKKGPWRSRISSSSSAALSNITSVKPLTKRFRKPSNGYLVIITCPCQGRQNYDLFIWREVLNFSDNETFFLVIFELSVLFFQWAFWISVLDFLR